MYYATETLWKILLLSCVLAPLVPAVTSSSKQHVIIASFYVDPEALKVVERVSGKDIVGAKAEVLNYISDIAHIIEGLKEHNINISVRLKNVVYLKSTLYPKMTRIDTALKDFTTWINNKNTSDYEGWDLAVLFTGLKMSPLYGSNGGYAYVSTVGTNHGTAMVQITGSHRAILIATHEIGHVIGGHHDGGKKAPTCSANGGYIMGGLGKFEHYKFSYSKCSAKSINATLHKMSQNRKNPLTNAWPSITKTVARLGEKVTPDEICRREFRQSAYFSRRRYTSYGDAFCGRLACSPYTGKDEYYSIFVYPPQGLVCGKDKRCDRTKCVHSSHVTAKAHDSCPYGDHPKIISTLRKMCSQLTPKECVAWKRTCCKTCNRTDYAKNMTADEVCRLLVGRKSSFAKHFQRYAYGDRFCSRMSCAGARYRRIIAPDGLGCGKGKRCIQGKCVVTPDGNQQMSDECPWGGKPFYLHGHFFECK